MFDPGSPDAMTTRLAPGRGRGPGQRTRAPVASAGITLKPLTQPKLHTPRSAVG
jgi:hypothetical protein